MEFYIGGCYQGKLEYVQAKGNHGLVVEGADATWELLEKTPICNHLHEFLRFQLALYSSEKEAEIEIEKKILRILESNPHIIFLCDEVGMGVVSMEREERDYRELVGRISIILARKADHVERVFCGMGQILK